MTTLKTGAEALTSTQDRSQFEDTDDNDVRADTQPEWENEQMGTIGET